MSVTESARPEGREAVTAALVDATIALIVEKGTKVSVREIAAAANVNHGLVHQYFAGKAGLMAAAFGEINRRAADDLDDDGLPPADLAHRRGGEMATALAYVLLEQGRAPDADHPVLTSWHAALLRTGRAASPNEADEKIAVAATLGLAWPLFRDHVLATLDVEPDRHARIDAAVQQAITDLGSLNP